MNYRTTIRDLNQTISPEQRLSLQALVGEEAWTSYERLVLDDTDDVLTDDDEYTLAIVQFVLALDEPEAFKAALEPGQREVLETIESALREELGF
jgi:hypothetical protein